MSPRNDDSDRARRRRLRTAIATSNGAGALTGALTQVIVSDPTISALVGTFVAGATADLMLQAAVARDEHHAVGDDELDALEGEDELADTLELEQFVEHDAVNYEDAELEQDVGEHRVDEHGVEVVEHHGGEQDAEDEDGDGHDGDAAGAHPARHAHGRRLRDTGHGYARCTTHHHAQPDTTPRPQRETTPHHLRHRHLRRAGQRFVHRYHQRDNGQQT